MRKIGSLLIVLILLISCVGTAFAADGDLPIDVKPPQNVSVNWMEGDDSPTTMAFSFSVDPEMTKIFIALDQARDAGILEAMLAQYGASDIQYGIQVDWALDDVNDPVSGWHYNQYWDDPYGMGFGRDEEGYCRVSEWDIVDWGFNNASETVQTYWIMRGVPDDYRWNGNPEEKLPGVKDQLNPDQYEYYEDAVHIDFTKHTAYFRVRFAFAATMESEDGTTKKIKFSDWSETCGYGKDIKKFEPLKDGDLAAPTITNIRLTDKEFNGQPVVAYTLTVSEDIAQKAANVNAAWGSLRVQTQARVKGDEEWTDIAINEVSSGEVEGDLVYLLKEGETIVDGTKVEVRCRYFCEQPGVDETIYSPWSDILAFETTEINNDPEPTPTETPVTPEPKPEEKKEEEAKKDKCPICGFCPQPLGLCIFIWIAIIVVIAVVVIIVVKKSRKDGNKRE